MAKAVLAVDDDPDFLELLRDVLESEGYDVTTCRTGKPVHELARKLQPSVVVVDLLMPDQSGWEIIERLKQDPTTARSRIIVCTGATREVTRHADKLRRWGCEVLLKPFELGDLLALLAKATTPCKTL